MVWVMGSDVVVVADPELAAPEAVVSVAEVVAAAELVVVAELEPTCAEASWSKATSARMAALMVAR